MACGVHKLVGIYHGVQWTKRRKPPMDKTTKKAFNRRNSEISEVAGRCNDNKLEEYVLFASKKNRNGVVGTFYTQKPRRKSMG